VQFIAAGFDYRQFWHLTPRSYALIMKGWREGDRQRRLAMAEAVRAATRLERSDYEKWVSAVSGQDNRLPEAALSSALRSASAGLKTITAREALERMHQWPR
jgi:hypothetical protein